MNTPKLFLTDYASYNQGTQFEFGHWVDLTQFSDAEEFQQYITDHFAECDKISPLQDGDKRKETMFTDYEGLPASLYGEALSPSEIEKIYSFLDFLNDNGLEDFENESDNLLSLWNEYCSENRADDQIYNFDDDFFQTFLSNDPAKAFQMGVYSTINWSDEYIQFNGYGNLESLSDPSTQIDEIVLLEWILENKI